MGNGNALLTLLGCFILLVAGITAVGQRADRPDICGRCIGHRFWRTSSRNDEGRADRPIQEYNISHDAYDLV